MNELIAGGAIASLAVWGGLLTVPLGSRLVPLGLADPGGWFAGRSLTVAELPLIAMLIIGGGLLVADLLGKLLQGTFGSDLLAGVAIVTSLLLGEYVAGVLVVLMLSGGEALESRAVSRAGDVLNALARRMPTVAHRRLEGRLADVPLAELAVGDTIVVLPHEICPVDGTVVAGRGTMDESYLTGEPYQMRKAPGSLVLSGAINGEAALEVRADRVGEDSRYAKIMQVLRESEQQRPRLRRLADTLGGLYTPLALALALAAWWASGEAVRFLAVLVVANGFTTEVIAMNDGVLKQVVLLAAFIPLLIGTGGNVGAQSSTVVIRGLSTQRIQALGPLKAIGREAIAGALLGLLMLVVVVPFAWWRGEGPLVGAAVGISLMAITTLAATAGAALPLLFNRMGLDPALMSAPFITTATDVAGVFIYLRTAAWLLQRLQVG